MPQTTTHYAKTPNIMKEKNKGFLVPGLFSVPYSYFQRHGAFSISLSERQTLNTVAQTQSLFHPFNTESSVSLVHSQLTLSLSVKWHLASCVMVGQKNHKPNDSKYSSKQQSKANGDFLQSAKLIFSKQIVSSCLRGAWKYVFIRIWKSDCWAFKELLHHKMKMLSLITLPPCRFKLVKA